MKRHYAASCHDKRGFSTPEKAKAEIARSHPNVRMNTYFCPYCRMWHIGHARTK
jgi:hypothetical protein